MDYIRLIDISNKYPNLPNYVRQSDKLVNLYGLYRETNKLDFPLPVIDYITPVDDLKLRSIIGLRKNNQDTNIKYYTSQQLYSDMEASNIEGNPYFLNQAINSDFIILIDLEKFISIFEGLKEVENKQGIDMIENNFLNKDGSINYIKCMQYIDWILSKQELDEIDTDGVIPTQKISMWNVGDYDPIMMKWNFNKKTDKEVKDNLPNPTPEIKKWRLKRKRDFDRNGMGVYNTSEIKLNQLGRPTIKSIRTIKEGETFSGYEFKKISKFTLWALQTDPNSTPTEFAFQGSGDTVELL